MKIVKSTIPFVFAMSATAKLLLIGLVCGRHAGGCCGRNDTVCSLPLVPYASFNDEILEAGSCKLWRQSTFIYLPIDIFGYIASLLSYFDRSLITVNVGS